jgi:cytochrome d ubiquinol oxidase subunit I
MTHDLLFAAAGTGLEQLWAARMQMALTLGMHIILACFGVGMPVLMLIAEGRYLRSGEKIWKTLARRWSLAFAVMFAVGAVSGTVLSFELGMLWPRFMGTFGAVIGLPFTLEGFAFFIEAIFAGIYFYSWDKLPPRVHFLTGIPIAVSGLASAWFVVTSNAWMNQPRGFTLKDGVAIDIDPIAAMLNPATGAQTAHMIIAAYMVTGFSVAAFYAWERLRGRDTLYQGHAMTLGLLLGMFFALPQIAVGDWAAKMVAETQPVKLAAMEGQFQTEAGAPLRIGGWPNEETRRTEYAIELPGVLSWIAYGDAEATVRGLDDFPRADTPPVAIVHVAFQVMVGIGTFLAGLTVWGMASLILKRRWPQNKVFLYAIVAAGPFSILALEAGWVVTEVGRQPWIVHGIMRTSEAVTQAPGMETVFWTTLAIYVLLTTMTIGILRLLARAPLEVDNDGS